VNEFGGVSWELASEVFPNTSLPSLPETSILKSTFLHPKP